MTTAAGLDARLCPQVEGSELVPGTAAAGGNPQSGRLSVGSNGYVSDPITATKEAPHRDAGVPSAGRTGGHRQAKSTAVEVVRADVDP